jgi:hypothetical protein
MTAVPSSSIRVYLDTSALKLSVQAIEGFTPVDQVVNWGGHEFTLTVHKPSVARPIESINNAELKSEAKLLPQIAELAREGSIELVVQNETLVELWGLPRTTGKPFFGAPLKKVQAPFEYGRVVFAAFEDAEKLQYDFLARIKDARFIELQKACGAYQGATPPPRNQLLDAFHLWCAEASRSTHFLTCDMSLVRYVGNQKQHVPAVRVVLPSQLLAELQQ